MENSFGSGTDSDDAASVDQAASGGGTDHEGTAESAVSDANEESRTNVGTDFNDNRNDNDTGDADEALDRAGGAGSSEGAASPLADVPERASKAATPTQVAIVVSYSLGLSGPAGALSHL